MKLAFIFPALLVALAPAFSAPAPADLSGTWTWRFVMPDGSEVQPRVKLKQDGTNLTGTSSFRPGTESAITNGVINGDHVRFEVVRQSQGSAVVTRYAGTREGDVIRGQIESSWSGEPRTYEWVARYSGGIEGTWKWSTSFGDRRVEARVELKLDGEKLTGTMPGRGGQRTSIKNGSFKTGKVHFEVERGRDEFRSISKYDGTLDGDTIKGTVESDFGGNPRTSDWEATKSQ